MLENHRARHWPLCFVHGSHFTNTYLDTILFSVPCRTSFPVAAVFIGAVIQSCCAAAFPLLTASWFVLLQPQVFLPIFLQFSCSYSSVSYEYSCALGCCLVFLTPDIKKWLSVKKDLISKYKPATNFVFEGGESDLRGVLRCKGDWQCNGDISVWVSCVSQCLDL